MSRFGIPYHNTRFGVPYLSEHGGHSCDRLARAASHSSTSFPLPPPHQSKALVGIALLQPARSFERASRSVDPLAAVRAKPSSAQHPYNPRARENTLLVPSLLQGGHLHHLQRVIGSYVKSYHRHPATDGRGDPRRARARAMARQTRSGAQFSPYQLDYLAPRACLRDPEVIRLGFSIDASLHERIRAANLRAAQFAEQTEALPDEDEWEGHAQLCSRAPSPVSSITDSSLSSLSSQCPSPHASRPPSPCPRSAPMSRRPAPRTAPPGGIEKQRGKARGTLHRKKTPQQNAQSPYARPLKLSPQTHREGSPVTLGANLAATQSSSGGAWTGRRVATRGRPRIPELQELVEDGCRVIKWNGRDPRLIVDAEGRIVAILLGKPEDPDWDNVVVEAVKAMYRARVHVRKAGMWSPSTHRRGRYMALSAGVSFGGGQKRPGNLVHNRFFRRILRCLLRNNYIRRIAGFQSSGMAMFAPKLYQYFCSILTLLFEHHPELIHNFTNSVFPSIALNCGPDAVTFNHLDHLNLSNALCAITCGGDFDHTRSAALHLRTWNLAIECPSGATFLIPSAIVEHGNTSLQQGETQHSITQYAAGGLFRWVTYGFQSLKSLLAQKGGSELRASFDGEPGSRWKWALDLFSKVDQLGADRADVFCKRDGV
ncbi:hypothetical protein B0H15DRAFT_955806 [Mycena belliarum]|uniref:Uncharacterized protein n=1 Tax=Mycena belliarum TaxID=1033014 RepID=A0AAD6TQQ1_9AGAR|nr:hypothetical protein B0H15DRAFT_955806 [Mycena belliae]